MGYGILINVVGRDAWVFLIILLTVVVAYYLFRDKNVT